MAVPFSSSGGPRHLSEVRLENVLQRHSLSAEKGSIQRDRVPHHVDEARAIRIEELNHRVLELVVKRTRIMRRAIAGRGAVESMAQPVMPSMQPSIHQPSRILRLGAP